MPLTPSQFKARNKREGRTKQGKKGPNYHTTMRDTLKKKVEAMKKMSGFDAWKGTITRMEANADTHIAQIPHSEDHLGDQAYHPVFKQGKQRGGWR